MRAVDGEVDRRVARRGGTRQTDAEFGGDADGGKTASTPTPRAVFMQMRNVGDDDPPFANRQFRRAMCLAVDNQNVANNVVGEYGQIMSQLAPDFLPESNPDLEPYPYDPDRAEQLVEESGLAGAEFTLHTPQGRYLRDAEAAQAIVADIDSLPNVTANVNIRDPNSWISDLTSDTASEQPAASIVGWGGADFLVKTAIVQCSLVEGSWGGNCYDSLESAIQAANGIAEWEPYVEACREINRVLHEEYINIWLYNTSNLYGLSDRLDWEPMISEDVYPAQFDHAD